MKKTLLNIICIVVAIAIVAVVGYGLSHKTILIWKMSVEDEIGPLDADSITLTDSKVKVSFSDVILSPQEEERKLIVSTQKGTVSTKLSDSVIELLNWDALKKTQTVSYTATGYFVVDLDEISENDIAVNDEAKTVTIYIEHPYLETITVDPEKIMVGETKNGLFTHGDIEMTVSDYKDLEKEIQDLFEKKYNTAANGQTADDNAIVSVTGIYEPLVKAVDEDYSVEVEFR